MAEGNRKDPRARVLNMTVRYKSATVDEFIENHSHDISRGGIFIKTRSPFPAGTLLKFEVRIAEDQKLMHGVGRVVWRREADRAEEGYPAGMGIKFIKTGEGATELINQLVAARHGHESTFDAGVRQSVSESPAVRGDAAADEPLGAPSARPTPVVPGPTSAPVLQVESSPRSLPSEPAETAVTAPAKKRQGPAEEKRKVVLQGSALEAAPAKPAPAAAAAEPQPAREHRGSLAAETTAPRARARPAKAQSESPRAVGLLLLLALVGAVVFVVDRVRNSGTGAPPEAPVSAEPGEEAPPELGAPREPANPDPAAEVPGGADPAARPEQAPAAAGDSSAPAGEEAEGEPGAAVQERPAAAPAAPPAPSASPPTSGAPAASSGGAAQKPAVPAPPVAPRPPAAPARPQAAPPATAAPAPAPAAPVAPPSPPPQPPAATRPVPPAVSPPASPPPPPPASEPEPPAAPARPVPPPPAAAPSEGSGGRPSTPPSPPPQPPPAAAPGAPAAPPPPPAPPADDNPY